MNYLSVQKNKKMKKIWFKKSLITSIFSISVLWIPFYSEASSKYTDFFSSKNIFLFLALLLCFSFWVMYISQHWLHKKIKPVNIKNSPANKYPIIVQYEPPKWINSAEAGLLFNCRVDPVDLTSLFYQWVNDKLIRIDYSKDDSNPKKIKNITLIKMRDIPETYPYYEKDLFNNIFKWDKKTKFIDKNTDLSNAVTLEWLEDLWLRKHRLHRGGKISFWWIILSLVFIALIVLCFYYFKWLWIFSLILFVPLFCGILFKQNNKIRLTEAWEKITADIMWYAKFIEKCDKDVFKKFLKEDPLFVDKTLPYAVAFGLETQFLEKVTPLLKDIEQSRLFKKSYPQFPVLDTVSLIKMSLSKIWNNWKILEYGARNLPWWTNYSKSWWGYKKLQRDRNKKPRDFGKFSYDKSLWFKIWSILLEWWKLFKKWGGGWWWGGKSW